MHLQGMVFVRVWARQQPPTDFFCCFFFSLSLLLRIKGLHKHKLATSPSRYGKKKKARLRRESGEEGANLLTDPTGDLDLFVKIPAVKDRLE